MQKTLFNIIICWLYCFTLHANAADTATHIIVHDSAFLNLIEKNVKPIILYTNGIWLEGPQVLPDKSLIFSDVKANMVLRYDEHNGVSVWLSRLFLLLYISPFVIMCLAPLSESHI